MEFIRFRKRITKYVILNYEIYNKIKNYFYILKIPDPLGKVRVGETHGVESKMLRAKAFQGYIRKSTSRG